MTNRRLPGHGLHPATMFFLLTLLVVLLSWICDVYGLAALRPDTGEEMHVQSLLSPEGIRWWLRNVVTNFTGFAPLGLVMVAMFGMGVARHAGLADACMRCGVLWHLCPKRIVLCVIFLGLLSNVVGDAGYVLLLPLAATLFHSAGLHPVGGIVVAYVSVACGYSANVVPAALDAQLALATQEAADVAAVGAETVGPLCNYYFLCVSTFLLAGLIYRVTWRYLLPSLRPYGRGLSFAGGHKQLSRKERRALAAACVAGGLYVAVIACFTFSSWGILRSVRGGLLHSPFIVGILFLISFGMGLMGMVYGFASGRYRTDTDVIEGLVQPMKPLGGYFVTAFFAAQMFACIDYSRLDTCLAVVCAESVSAVCPDGLPALVLLILFTAVINLVMVSTTAKWAFISFMSVPALGGLGISPDVAQCAFRIGDSATNVLTPFMLYLPLVLSYMRHYDNRITYASLLQFTWKYSFLILVGWTALFVLWYAAGLPWGM